MRRKILPYNKHLVRRARQLRKTMTKGEIILWQHLRKKQILGVSFLRQRPIDQFIVDFYCKDWMLAIEIDGSSHDSLAAQERDAYRQAKLEALGVSFLRFSEYDAQNHPEAIAETIKTWLLTHPQKKVLPSQGS
ncbi:endonuclease domain-containing protein [Synechococcus sp. BDU 130192]|uniref:endonuclease domain-containing protein n=1 Tax=Synechococcus sp. BDU 130192 TaxID=2042059 RepID=UPI000C087E4D|nr:endonuclease domain-containing protein [Synechococcus sp. BDU 130192]